MSAMLFGARVRAHRSDVSPSQPSIMEVTAESREAAPSPTQKDKWLTVLAGLVPADILAAHAVFVDATTETTEDPPLTKITDVDNLELAFWVLVVLSVLLCALGRIRANRPWNWLVDPFMLAVPALAFVGWTMLQPTSAFDGAFPDVSENARLILAGGAAIALTAITATLTPAEEPDGGGGGGGGGGGAEPVPPAPS